MTAYKFDGRTMHTATILKATEKTITLIGNDSAFGYRRQCERRNIDTTAEAALLRYVAETGSRLEKIEREAALLRSGIDAARVLLREEMT